MNLSKRDLCKAIVALPFLGLFSRPSTARAKPPWSHSTTIRLEDMGDEPANGDWTWHCQQALAVIKSFPQGGCLKLEAKTYLIPQGIVSDISGLEIVGTGHGAGGPSTTGYGSIIKYTEAGAWGIKAINPGQYSRYHGPFIHNVSLLGNHQTEGGLYTQVAFTTVRDLYVHMNTKQNATGILVDPTVAYPNPDDASWFKATDIHLQNNWNQLHLRGKDSGCHITNMSTIKVGSGGIVRQGHGVITEVGNVLIANSKTEGNDRGWDIRSRSGVKLANCSSEGENTSFHLDRAEMTPTSQIYLNGCSSSGSNKWLYVGPNQYYDKIAMLKWSGAMEDFGRNTQFLW